MKRRSHSKFLRLETLEVRFVLATFTDTGFDISGGVAAWGDYNNDGWVDLCADGHVYRNDRGTLVRVKSLSGNSIWGDYDNDGYLDLFSFGSKRLYRNLIGDGDSAGELFENVSHLLPSFPMSSTLGATWGDFNGDSFLDLYVGGYEGGGYQPDVILINNEAQGFTTAWQQSGDIDPARGITAADFDDDGDIDVYVSNYRLEPNLLWRNDGTGNFTNVAASTHSTARNSDPGWHGGHSIGAAWGDFNSDGLIDLFAGNFAHDDGRGDQPESRFLRNRGSGDDYRFDDLGQRGVFYQESYASPAAGDYDNDGNLDLFFTTVYGTASFGVRNYPALFRNDGSWNFSNVAGAAGIGSLPPSYQAAWADFDNDGDLDLASAGNVYRNNENTETGNNWLKIRLVGAPGLINTSAIGAVVRAQVGSKTITRQVEGGTGQGNQNDLTLHFGLGTHHSPITVNVTWPDGQTRTQQVNPNTTNEIFYGTTPIKDAFTVKEDQVLSVNTTSGVLANDFNPLGEVISVELVDVSVHGNVQLNSTGAFQYTPNPDFYGQDTFTYRLLGTAVESPPATVVITVEPSPDPPHAVDDAFVVTEDVTYTTGVPAETAIALGAVWKYLDTGVDQGIEWQNVAYDDSAWFSGPAQLGYGDGDEVTEVQFEKDDNSKFATTYFRHHFKVVNARQITSLKMRLLRDDRAAVYLNGVDVFRDDRLPDDAAYDFYTGSGPVSDYDWEIFAIDQGRLIEGTNVLAVEVHQASPTSSDLSFDLELTAESDETVTLISAGSDWKYLDNGSDGGDAWRGPEFNDSNWLSGPAQLGYGEEDEATVVHGRYNELFKIPTTYFRHAFELSDVERVSEMRLKLKRDDGAAVYLNGTEILRDGLSPNATFDTFALETAVFPEEDEYFAFSLFPSEAFLQGILVNGTNLLAVEVHQASAGSSDLSFDLELIMHRRVTPGVLANDVEVDNEPMIVELLAPPQHGAVVMTGDGQFSYTPDSNFVGSDAFTYRNFDVTPVPQTLFEFGSTWRYQDDGSDQGVAWRYPDFDDATWSSGPGQLGYGDGDEATVVGFGPDTENKYATTYFRTEFEVVLLADPDLTARLWRDDAAAVYLNGVEVYRDTGLVEDAGFDVYATASGPIETVPASFSIPADLISLGTNVLAVEVHQESGSSSDISFDFELQGMGPGNFGADEATVFITVMAVNDLPLAVDDHYRVGNSQVLVVNPTSGVLKNDTDYENDPLVATMVSPPSHGSVQLASDGSFSYTPEPGYVGHDTFIYQALDVDVDDSTLIEKGSQWRYLDDGSDQGTAWHVLEFDDKAWSLGAAELGYGDGDEQTVVGFGDDSEQKYATTWFRQEFDVQMASRLESVDAWILRDDAAAVYLNGTQVFRDIGLSPTANFDTYTTGFGSDNATTIYPIDPNLLVDGMNVIAVEVHQTAGDSSDLSFDFELTVKAIVPVPATVNIEVTSTPAGDVNLDDIVDASDIDDLYTAIGASDGALRYDVNGDGAVGSADVDFLINNIFNTTLGDTDLDGDVDTGDLTRAFIGFTGAGSTGKGWADGDTNGDGDVDTGDLTAAIIRFTGATR